MRLTGCDSGRGAHAFRSSGLRCVLLAGVVGMLAANAVGDILGIGLGTAAPPGSLGGFPLSALPADPTAVFTDVTSVPGNPPLTGTVKFSTPLSHRKIGSGWGSWSHGYTGDVYYTNGGTSVTMYLPFNTVAFVFYAEPNPFGEFSIKARTNEGTIVTQIVEGFAGAKGFGFYTTGCDTLSSITISSTVDFAIGEFRGQKGGIVGVKTGTAAPSSTLGPYSITKLPPDPTAVFTDVTAVPGKPPLTGPVEFSIPLSHRKIGSGWGSWSHGYTGDVYYTNGAMKATVDLPANTVAFLMYIEPNLFGLHTVTATANDGTKLTSSVEGFAGAEGFGFFTTGGTTLTAITVETTDTDFAIGEFYGASGGSILAVPLGTAAPPPSLGLHPISALPPDPTPVGTSVVTVPGAPPLTGDLGVAFFTTAIHKKIGDGWATWSHGYTGDVYHTDGGTLAIMLMPPNTVAFAFYVEPNPFGVHKITAMANDGTSISQDVEGFAGAKGFGYYTLGCRTISFITIESTVDFAFGEFYGAQPGIPGDLNGSGCVDQQDLGILLSAYGKCVGQTLYNPVADIFPSGCIDQQDLGVLLSNYGKNCP